MITVTETLFASKPPGEVFSYIADFTTVAEWDPGIVSSTRASGDGEIGTTYDVVADFRGREVAMVYEIVDLDAPSVIVLRGTGAAVSALDRIECHAHEQGTRIVYVAEFQLKGVMRFVEPFLGGTFSKLGRKAIGGLDRVLND